MAHMRRSEDNSEPFPSLLPPLHGLQGANSGQQTCALYRQAIDMAPFSIFQTKIHPDNNPWINFLKLFLLQSHHFKFYIINKVKIYS